MTNIRKYIITLLIGVVIGFIPVSIFYFVLKYKVEAISVYTYGRTENLKDFLFSKNFDKETNSLLIAKNGVASFVQYKSPIQNLSAEELISRIKEIGKFGVQRANGRRTHEGIDIPSPEGTNLVPIANGVVIHTGHYFKIRNVSNVDYGNTVIVKLDDETIISYSHLKNDTISVKVGQKVTPETVVGQVGMTGDLAVATGEYKYAHLHMELYKPGATLENGIIFGTLIDPDIALKLMSGGISLELINARANREIK